MNKENGNLKFEEFVQNSYNVPPISGEFYNNLYAELMTNAGNIRIVPKKSTHLVRFSIGIISSRGDCISISGRYTAGKGDRRVNQTFICYRQTLLKYPLMIQKR